MLDFLPLERRLVRREGISLHSIQYWSDTLAVWIGERQKMLVRYDPRDLSRIFLLAPDGRYYDVGYRDLRRPPISLWEQQRALQRLRAEGRREVDEAAIFNAVEQMRAIASDAVRESKSARRQRERRWQRIQGGRSAQTPVIAPSAHPGTGQAPQTTVQPWERMLPVEDWS